MNTEQKSTFLEKFEGTSNIMNTANVLKKEKEQMTIDKAKTKAALSHKKIISVEDMTEEDLFTIVGERTVEDIKALSKQEFSKLFVTTDGTPIFDVENDFEMSRDYIEYIMNTDTAFKMIDVEMAKYQAAIDEFNAEVGNLMKTENKSVNTIFKEEVIKLLEGDDISEDQRKKYTDIRAGFEDAITLAPLIELYTRINGKNAVKAKDVQLGTTARHYVEKICKELGSEPRLMKLGNFEARAFGEEYKHLNNLLIYVVMNWLKHTIRLDKNYHATFIIQLSMYMNLLLVKEQDELIETERETIELFRTNVLSLLNIISK